MATHERNTKVGSKKRRSKRFKSEECNLVKDAAHCVALLEIDFYALPTGEIFLSDLLRSGWNGLVTFEYNVNGVRCGGFVSNWQVDSCIQCVIRLEFLFFSFLSFSFFIYALRCIFFSFPPKEFWREIHVNFYDRYGIILVTYSKAIIDYYKFKSDIK